jgi:hypothetical protein
VTDNVFEFDLTKLPTIQRYVSARKAILAVRDELKKRDVDSISFDTQIRCIGATIGCLLFAISRGIHQANGDGEDPLKALPLVMRSIMDDLEAVLRSDILALVRELGEVMPPGATKVVHILKVDPPKDPKTN